MELIHHNPSSTTEHKAALNNSGTANPLSESEAELGFPLPIHDSNHARREMTPSNLINFQRTYGNQATTRLITRMIQRQASGIQLPNPSSEAEAKPAITTITTENRDPIEPEFREEIGGTEYYTKAKYDVYFTPDECYINVKIKLEPQPGVTEEQLDKIKQGMQHIFPRIFDNKFKLTDVQTQKSYNLRAQVTFVERDEHHIVKIHPDSGKGIYDRANALNWYVSSNLVTLAHEMGHLLGLQDENYDRRVTSRKDRNSPNIFTDNTIMGAASPHDTHFPDRPKAGLKLRHGRKIANDISIGTGRILHAEELLPASSSQNH